MSKTLRSSSSLLLTLSLAFGGAALACDANTAGSEQSWRVDPNGVPVDDGGGEAGGGDGDGCTLTQGYWKNHADAWPLESDAEMCGSTMLEILETPPKGGDAWIILAHQYIAASLNVASGVVAPADVAAALDQAELLLTDCTITADEKAEALTIAGLLDAFNNGDVGPGHCGDSETSGGEDTGGGDTGDTDGPCTTGDHDTDGTTGDPLPIPQ